MFLTISEDGGKISRFWGEITMRTHHVKLPWEKQSSTTSTPVIFRVCHRDLLMVIVNQSFRVNWIQIYIVGISWYKQNVWFQQIFISKTKKILVAVNTNNFKCKKPNNENQRSNILPKNYEQNEF